MSGIDYAVTFFAPGLFDALELRVGVDVTGSMCEIRITRGEGFEDWRDSGLVTTEGTVGELNRAALHRLVDAWIDGVTGAVAGDITDAGAPEAVYGD